MLSIPGNARLFICQHPVNMRKSFEGLSALRGAFPRRTAFGSFIHLSKSPKRSYEGVFLG